MNQEELNNRLSEIKDKLIDIVKTNDVRTYLSCEAENSLAVNKFVYQGLGVRFMIITGIDSEDCFEVLYHFSND